jgi:hypothetical protein
MTGDREAAGGTWAYVLHTGTCMNPAEGVEKVVLIISASNPVSPACIHILTQHTITYPLRYHTQLQMLTYTHKVAWT